MKLPGFSTELTPKDRLLAILTVGVAAIAAAYVMLDTEESIATQSTPKPAGNIAVAAQKPVMPIGYQPGTTVKDPFAVAPEYVPPVPKAKVQEAAGTSLPRNTNPGSNSGMSASKEKSKSQLPEVRLTGVAGTDGSRLAILQLGDKSQPYALNEAVGPYRLIAINRDSAVLTGPDGQKVIQLGR